MREVRHITVAVTPELYRQTRKLAAEMDSTVTAMVAYLLERFPSYLKGAGYKVTVPPGAPHHLPGRPPHGAPPAPNCQTCTRVAPPVSTTPEKNANSDCTAVKPSQATNLSETSEARPHADTAPVRQYDSSNPNNTKNLPEESESAYSRCTPVWGRWFRRVITRNK
jgi:hypothetical protein